MEGDVSAPAPTPGTGAQPQPAKKKMSTLKKVLIGLGIGFVAVIVLLFFMGKALLDASNAFVADLQAGECTAIYERTSTGFQENTSAEEWDAVCNQVSPILQGEPKQTGIEVNTSSDDVSVGQAVYEIVGTDEITYEVTLILVDEDGWKLEGLDSSAKGLELPEDTTAEEDAVEETN